jgi:hypothetical protein
MPGTVAGFLRTIEVEPAERAAPGQEMTLWRGQGCILDGAPHRY